MPKALATRIPVSFSRVTRLISSSLACIFVDNGVATLAMSSTNTIMTGIEISRIVDIVLLFASARMIPPIHMIGAIRHTLRNILINVCTWTTSLFVRVIREEVEKRSNSVCEKYCILEKTLLLTFFPSRTDATDAMSPVDTPLAIPSSTKRSIRPLMATISPISLFGIAVLITSERYIGSARFAATEPVTVSSRSRSAHLNLNSS